MSMQIIKLFCSGFRNGSRLFTVSEQAEKNRSVKNVLLEKEGRYANGSSKRVRLEKFFAFQSAIMV
jgi:hypothetical protein